jgi:hypothetical protein
MKLEEDLDEQGQAKQQTTDSTMAEGNQATTNLNQNILTPSKRKFLKTSQSTLVTQESSNTNATKSKMVSLHEMANQGP